MKKLLLPLAALALAAAPLPAEELTITWSEQGFSNQQQITEFVSAPLTLTFNKASGSTQPTYYDNGSALRMYKNNTLIIKIDPGYVIESVEFKANTSNNKVEITADPNGEITYDDSTLITSWVVNSGVEEVTFTSNKCQISSTTIIYSEVASEKEENGLAFPEEAYSANLFGTFTSPVLTNPNNLTGIVYTSSNEDVATVDSETGEVTLVGLGETDIKVTFDGDEIYKPGAAHYLLTVFDGRQEFTLSFPESSYSVNLGDSFSAPELIGLPEGLNVVYSSDAAETVASVNAETGEVTIIGRGLAVITAKFEGNNEYKPAEAQYSLTVIDPDNLQVIFDFINNDYGMERLSGNTSQYNPANTEVKSEPVTLIVNEHTRLWADGLRLYSGGEVEVTIADGYTIIDEQKIICKDKTGNDVKNLEVKPNETGNYVIKYTATKSNVAIATLTIEYQFFETDKEACGLAFDKEDYEANLYGSFTAPELINPNNLLDINYSSSNEDVATVETETGAIMLKGLGTTVITASFSGDDTYLQGTASYTLNVIDGRENINLSFPEKSYSVQINEEFTAPELTGLPEGLIVVYSSNADATVASVNAETGEVTIIGAGLAVITASFAGNDEYKPAEAQYSLSVIDPANLEVIFDFVNNDYGMERLSGNTQQYNPADTEIVSAPVTLIVNEHTRLWADGLRFYKEGLMEITIENGYVIENVSYTDKNGNGNNSNLSVAKDDTGKYAIAYLSDSGNVAMSTLTIKYSDDVSSGIDTLTSDEMEAVYFDLSGRRVQGQPEKGLYIKVCGDKVSKVIL